MQIEALSLIQNLCCGDEKCSQCDEGLQFLRDCIVMSECGHMIHEKCFRELQGLQQFSCNQCGEVMQMKYILNQPHVVQIAWKGMQIATQRRYDFEELITDNFLKRLKKLEVIEEELILKDREIALLKQELQQLKESTNISEDSRWKNNENREQEERENCILPSCQSIHLNGKQEDINLDKENIQTKGEMDLINPFLSYKIVNKQKNSSHQEEGEKNCSKGKFHDQFYSNNEEPQRYQELLTHSKSPSQGSIVSNYQEDNSTIIDSSFESQEDSLNNYHYNEIQQNVARDSYSQIQRKLALYSARRKAIRNYSPHKNTINQEFEHLDKGVYLKLPSPTKLLASNKKRQQIYSIPETLSRGWSKFSKFLTSN